MRSPRIPQQRRSYFFKFAAGIAAIFFATSVWRGQSKLAPRLAQS